MTFRASQGVPHDTNDSEGEGTSSGFIKYECSLLRHSGAGSAAPAFACTFTEDRVKHEHGARLSQRCQVLQRRQAAVERGAAQPRQLRLLLLPAHPC